MLNFLRRTAWLVILLCVTACGQLPPDYSANYVRIPVASETSPDRVRYVMVPEACLRPDPTASNTLGDKLPPGCANAYNLQRMAEHKGDLEQGRKLSPAPAAPSVRAAQKYLDGTHKDPPKDPALGGASDSSSDLASSTDTGDTQTSSKSNTASKSTSASNH